jgi:hypothetical protein
VFRVDVGLEFGFELVGETGRDGSQGVCIGCNGYRCFGGSCLSRLREGQAPVVVQWFGAIDRPILLLPPSGEEAHSGATTSDRVGAGRMNGLSRGSHECRRATGERCVSSVW